MDLPLGDPQAASQASMMIQNGMKHSQQHDVQSMIHEHEQQMQVAVGMSGMREREANPQHEAAGPAAPACTGSPWTKSLPGLQWAWIQLAASRAVSAQTLRRNGDEGSTVLYM